ncbi:unnamed protein product [Hapterophycus canaliculatus]
MTEEEIDYCIGKPESVEEQQGGCASDNDSTCFDREMTVLDLKEESKIFRRRGRCGAHGDCGGGGGGVGIQRRRCTYCCCSDPGDDFRNEEESPGALRKPESATTTKKTAQRRSPETTFQRTRDTRIDVHTQSDDEKLKREASLSQCRCPQSIDTLNEDFHDGGSDGRDVSGEKVAPGLVHSGPPRPPSKSPESNNSSLSGAFHLPSTCRETEDGKEEGEEEGEEEERSSCALARKRALLRVRLARQRQELEKAVVDANGRGLRAERRRRREKKLAALLTKAQGEGGGFGSASAVGYRSVRVRDRSDSKRGGKRSAGGRRAGGFG